MARLEMTAYDGSMSKATRMAKVTLSRRNLLALLHMEGSNRRIENNVVYFDGELSDDPILVLCCEDDQEHYSDPRRLGGKAGVMHPETETFIRRGLIPQEPKTKRRSRK